MSDLSEILFHVEPNEIDDLDLVTRQLKTILEREAPGKGYFIEYTFQTAEEIHKVNIEHLSHNYPTDIITFDLSEKDNFIEADIVLSPEVISENAVALNLPMEQELKRVLIHGLLHLVGYDDKTVIDQKKMRSREDYYLNDLFHVEL
jgi:rRNA maturation RNase YbeY